MKILGIDPGTARIGWAIIEEHKSKTTALDYGCLTTLQTHALPLRLREIYQKLNPIIESHAPDCISVEELFFSKNITTAIAVSHARGVILLAAAEHNIPVVSYTPTTVKLTICGYGKAEKHQVQTMTAKLLKLPRVPTPDDTADALAVALTHAFRYRSQSL